MRDEPGPAARPDADECIEIDRRKMHREDTTDCSPVTPSRGVWLACELNEHEGVTVIEWFGDPLRVIPDSERPTAPLDRGLALADDDDGNELTRG